MVERRNIFVILLPLVFVAVTLHAQTVPENEFQANLNTYFDSFDVQIIYPSFSLTRKVSESTSFNTRYLVDLVTAASIRSNIHADNAVVSSGGDDDDDDRNARTRSVDGVTAASGRGSGGGRGGIGETEPAYQPDDVRHELGLGISQVLVGGVASLNALYSKESDYRSRTLAGTYTRSFLNNNTSVQLGSVRSWDESSPKVFLWTKKKNETNLSANLTQIWTPRLISQTIFSYIDSRGLLSDPYEVVTITQGNQTLRLEPAHPDHRVRQAVGTRLNYKLDKQSAVHLGLRYYWDDWQVRSLTSTIGWDRHLNDVTTLHLGYRNFVQSRAFFFKTVYAQPETYMSVDSKLDAGSSNEVEVEFTFQGHDRFDMPTLLMNDNIQYNLNFALYQRHTEAPNWFSRKNNLIAFIASVGVRYHF